MFCAIDHARCSRKRTLCADAVRQMWQTPTLRSTGRESMLRLLHSTGILPLPLKKWVRNRVGSLPCGALLLPSRLKSAVSCVYIPRTTDASNAYNRSICQERTRKKRSTTGRASCSEWNSQPHHVRLSRVGHGKTGTGGANERWQAAPHKHGR